MAKVHNFLDLWQGSQSLHATKKESHAQNKQMTAIGYISDSEEIIEASWSNFHHDGGAAVKLSERSPLPPALSAKDLAGGGNQVLHVRQIKRVNRHPGRNDKDSTPDSISITKNWLDGMGDLESPNATGDDREADSKSAMELDSCMEAPQSTENRCVNAPPNVPRSIQPTWRLIPEG